MRIISEKPQKEGCSYTVHAEGDERGTKVSHSALDRLVAVCPGWAPPRVVTLVCLSAGGSLPSMQGTGLLDIAGAGWCPGPCLLWVRLCTHRAVGRGSPGQNTKGTHTQTHSSSQGPHPWTG